MYYLQHVLLKLVLILYLLKQIVLRGISIKCYIHQYSRIAKTSIYNKYSTAENLHFVLKIVVCASLFKIRKHCIEHQI